MKYKIKDLILTKTENSLILQRIRSYEVITKRYNTDIIYDRDQRNHKTHIMSESFINEVGIVLEEAEAKKLLFILGVAL